MTKFGIVYVKIYGLDHAQEMTKFSIKHEKVKILYPAQEINKFWIMDEKIFVLDQEWKNISFGSGRTRNDFWIEHESFGSGTDNDLVFNCGW